MTFFNMDTPIQELNNAGMDKILPHRYRVAAEKGKGNRGMGKPGAERGAEEGVRYGGLE